MPVFQGLVAESQRYGLPVGSPFDDVIGPGRGLGAADGDAARDASPLAIARQLVADVNGPDGDGCYCES